MLAATACVHSDIQYVGRTPLGGGREGLSPILVATPDGYEEVAVITVNADLFNTSVRRQRHLRRKASLLGCDALVPIRAPSSTQTTGICVRSRQPQPQESVNLVVAPPPADLLERAAHGGPSGLALLKVLRQSANSREDAKAWPLQWYLSNYPQSPFRADVEALMTTRDSNHRDLGTATAMLTAPSLN